MNSTQIAKALADGPGMHEYHALVAACGVRRDELRVLMQNAAQREAASLKGLDAIVTHDAEQERYAKELPLLDALEIAINDALEAAITAKVRREIPVARKQLPRKIGQVREALAALDSALAEVAATVATLAEYQRLADPAIPLSDAELAELLRVRDAVWIQRNLAALIPRRETHPESWLLANVVKPSGDFYAKRPGIHLPDYVNER